MATAARDHLARTLGGGVQAAFSTGLTARPDDLALEVEGFGRVRFPVTPARARTLIGLGHPARFGRGEETLTDPRVRDTWEIPRALVRAEWDAAALKDILATVKDELGLPRAALLTADLHSLLVYEPGQFFLPHQDTEKDDSMVGTLVVTLPSSYAGGELIVGRGGEQQAYRGSRAALSLAAFYAGCQHEVRKVRSGYRITLTYDLLLDGDTSRPASDDGTVTEVTELLREHFSTPVRRYYGTAPARRPNRLVYLLDHEYTPRGLAWHRLKGADASRAALLRSAAAQAGLETVLALADIKTTHSAFPADDGYGYWDEDWNDGNGDGDWPGGPGGPGEERPVDVTGSESRYEIDELIESTVTLTHWTAPDGTGLEEASLDVDDTEVCASTPDGDLTPYSSEYEGYMGNYGNTLDRWYHRAAILMWPAQQAFANRAESSPGWALGAIAAMASAGDVPGARAAAATLAPFWDKALGGRARAGSGRLFGPALRAAGAVADAQTAAMLLGPFRIEDLDHSSVDSFGQAAGRYGDPWTASLLQAWFGGQPAWAGGGPERPRWIADQLPGLCARLLATGRGGRAAGRQLTELSWKWLSRDIGAALAAPSPTSRAGRLGDLGAPLAAVLTAAATTGAARTRDTVTAWVRSQPDAVTALELAALRAAAAGICPSGTDDGVGGGTGLGELAADCAARLRARLARPPRTDGDWSVGLPVDSCGCELCGVLRGFLQDGSRPTFEWPLAKDGRQHIHARIDTAEFPVTHVTRRQGRPYTLVLTKTSELFTAEQQARAQDEADLRWLTQERKSHPDRGAAGWPAGGADDDH